MSTVILFLILMIYTIEQVAKFSQKNTVKELANIEVEKKKQAEQRAKLQTRERAKKQAQADKKAEEHAQLAARLQAQLEAKFQSVQNMEPTIPMAVFSAAIDMYESEQQ